MVASIHDLHKCELDGTDYWFRTPTVYDLAKVRRQLAKQGLRRPHPEEFRIASLAGIEALGEAVGEVEEADRQKAVMTEWYKLAVPIKEDDLDEPDLVLRAAELARLKGERQAAQTRLFPDVVAIEANLGRHWPPYCDLLADRGYFDEVSNIEIVRLLLVRVGSGSLQIGPDGLLSEDTYQLLPGMHRPPLAMFAAQLAVPTEAERKN